MICSDCKKECEPKLIDVGIGPYEYWGSCEVHHDWRDLSPCCEAECIEEPDPDDDYCPLDDDENRDDADDSDIGGES